MAEIESSHGGIPKVFQALAWQFWTSKCKKQKLYIINRIFTTVEAHHHLQAVCIILTKCCSSIANILSSNTKTWFCALLATSGCSWYLRNWIRFSVFWWCFKQRSQVWIRKVQIHPAIENHELLVVWWGRHGTSRAAKLVEVGRRSIYSQNGYKESGCTLVQQRRSRRRHLYLQALRLLPRYCLHVSHKPPSYAIADNLQTISTKSAQFNGSTSINEKKPKSFVRCRRSAVGCGSNAIFHKRFWCRPKGCSLFPQWRRWQQNLSINLWEGFLCAILLHSPQRTTTRQVRNSWKNPLCLHQHVEMVAKDFQSTCKIILQSPPSSFPARCLHKMSFAPKLGSQIWYSTPVRSRYTPKQRNSQEETLNARIPSTKQEAKRECFSDTNCREYYLSNLHIEQLQLQNP